MKYILLLIVLVSCQKKKEDNNLEKIIGQWAIEQIDFVDMDYKDYLDSNFLLLRNDKTMSIPQTVHCIKDSYAKWNLQIDEVNNLKVTISSKNKIFNRTFNVDFIKDGKRKLVGMRFESDSTKFEIYKFLQNYDEIESDW